MVETKTMDPSECGQLNGRYSCEGCPIYEMANEIVGENPTDPTSKSLVLQLRGQCADGGQMDLARLGIQVEEHQAVVTRLRRGWIPW